MPQTVEVRFKGTRRDFFAWPDDQEPLRLREAVVVQTDRGQDLGRVQSAGQQAEKKCGSCASCGVGVGIAEGRAGGRIVEPAAGDDLPGDAPPPGPTADAAPDAAADAAPTAAAPAADGPPDVAPAGPAGPAPDPEAPGLRPILRRATQADIGQANELRKSEEELRRQVMDRVRQHRLDMRVSDTEWQWDRGKLTIYFTAEKRVDFRALVRELASAFRTRIELRQIGVRDEAARLGGVGRCGREFCCSTWLKELNPVSLALAKDQHLSLNPSQISGGCGRLLCCLKYEHEFYVAARKRFPREGKAIETRHGTEKVVAVDIFRERVFLRSEAHGPRIIPLVQLREEQEVRAAGGEALAAPSAAAGRPATERRDGPPRRPETTHSRRPEPPAPSAPASSAPARQERREPAPERRTGPRGQPGRRGPHPDRATAPPETAALPPAPNDSAPRPEPAAPAPTGGEGGRKRRRRGRRGRGGPPTNSPPEA